MTQPSIAAVERTPSYTFETFVVSEGSERAFAASVSVAENPGRLHNPLFLHGRSGGGKTHLLHAIAHALRSRRPDANVLHISADGFAQRLLNAIRLDEVAEFRSSIMAADALLLDDLDLLVNRRATMQELLAHLEELVARGKQVVCASAVPPETLALDAWCASVSGSTLIAEVGYPDAGALVEMERRAAAKRSVTPLTSSS